MELIRILGERLDRLNKVIEKVLIVFVCALVCVITYEVIVRYFFGRPVIWARDVAVWLYGAHFLLPVVYHYACNRQICASDLIYNLRLTDRQRAAIDLVSNAFLAALAILLFMPAVNRMLVAVRFDERSIMTLWRPPLWPYFLLIPTMLVMVGLQALRALVQATLVLGKSGDAA